MSKIQFFLFYICLLIGIVGNSQTNISLNTHQRVVVMMIDGFGMDYYLNSDMPNLKMIANKGYFKNVHSLMPSVTNLNNSSICTGEWPEVHGIVGNSYLDTKTGNEEFMESDSLLLAPTLFERAKAKGIHSMLFSSKKKSTGLLFRGTDEAVSPETANTFWIDHIGKTPSIYSREVNYWLFEAALYSMKTRPEISLFYIHTTDYPMHTWAPESAESKEHLKNIDSYIGKILALDSNTIILLTADHHVNHKSFCWDLQKALSEKNITIKMAISPERDKYFKHHRGFGGSAFVYLNNAADENKVIKNLKSLKGIEEVLTRSEAAKRFHLMPERIGDLIVLADSTTVFGELDTASEILPENYRSHGSIYETNVPVFMYIPKIQQAYPEIQYNFEITRWLYR